jgi:hypothetical protein
MVNRGSGADGASTSREGDVTCLLIGATTTKYTDRNGVTTAIVGYEAKECETGVAPTGLCLGAWHDVVDVGARGRVQCCGWDDDVRVLTDAAALQGNHAVATTAEPYAAEVNGLPAGETGALITITELTTNMANSTEANYACYLRCA